MAQEYSFSVLWGSNETKATEDFQPYKTNEEARAARDLMASFLKALGLKVTRRTLRGQVRQYWGWGIPCGGCCNVYDVIVEG